MLETTIAERHGDPIVLGVSIALMVAKAGEFSAIALPHNVPRHTLRNPGPHLRRRSLSSDSQPRHRPVRLDAE